MLKIGIVANEVSGDQLGSSLIRALRDKHPDIQFEGMTGPMMEEAGCYSLAKIEPVMGLVEVLKHLKTLLRIRNGLHQHFLDNPPDLFVGIDAPDFNLKLEAQLRASGIQTAHFVSPTVWAWRQKRVHKIRKAVDLMLCIFPFEVDFLEQHGVPASYVGHPLADEIPLDDDGTGARARLGLDQELPVIAILPGSRMSELKSLAATFIQTAEWCLKHQSRLRFIAPLVNSKIREAFENEIHAVAPDLPIQLVDGNSRDVILAADIVLTASGTATLEAMLLKRPMVVAYRLHWLTYWLVKTFDLVKIPYFAMVNLLTDEPLAPEFLQDQCRPEILGKALLDLLDNPERRENIRRVYRQTHENLRQDAAAKAADQILALIEKGGRGK